MTWKLLYIPPVKVNMKIVLANPPLSNKSIPSCSRYPDVFQFQDYTLILEFWNIQLHFSKHFNQKINHLVKNRFLGTSIEYLAQNNNYEKKTFYQSLLLHLLLSFGSCGKTSGWCSCYTNHSRKISELYCIILLRLRLVYYQESKFDFKGLTGQEYELVLKSNGYRWQHPVPKLQKANESWQVALLDVPAHFGETVAVSRQHHWNIQLQKSGSVSMDLKLNHHQYPKPLRKMFSYFDQRIYKTSDLFKKATSLQVFH